MEHLVSERFLSFFLGCFGGVSSQHPRNGIVELSGKGSGWEWKPMHGIPHHFVAVVLFISGQKSMVVQNGAQKLRD